MSGIFYAGNTEFRIPYVDCLFLCVSAMTVTGLATNNLSQLTGFQQALLFVQMIGGNIITISLVMIMVRQYFFRQEFRHIIEARRKAELEVAQRNGVLQSPLQKLRRLSQSFASNPIAPTQPVPHAPPSKLRWTDLFRHSAPPTAENTPRHSLDDPRPPRSDDSHQSTPSSFEKTHRDHQSETAPRRPPMPERPTSGGKIGKKKGKGWKGTKLRTDMIQRVEGGGVGLVNPMGWYHSPLEGREEYELREAPPPPVAVGIIQPPPDDPSPETIAETIVESPTELSRAQTPEPPYQPEPRRSSEPTHHHHHDHLSVDPPAVAPEEKFPRTKTIAFDDAVDRERPFRGGNVPSAQQHEFAYPSVGRTTGYMPRTGTIRSSNAGLPMTKSGSTDVFPLYNVHTITSHPLQP